MTTKEKAEITKETKNSIRQPAWHVLVLGYFTFGIYLFYWFYKTWRDLKAFAIKMAANGNDKAEKENSSSKEYQHEVIAKYANIRPWLRTLSFFLPLLLSPLLYFTPLKDIGLDITRGAWLLLCGFLAATLFKDIASLIPNEDSWARINAVRASFVLTLCIPMCLVFCILDNFCYLLYLLVTIPIAVVQHWLNQFYESQETETLALRTAPTPLETIVIVIGALWMGLVLMKLLEVQ